MKMVDMELPKKNRKDDQNAPCCATEAKEPKYPWGLQINLDNNVLKKLPGLKDGKINGKVQIVASADIVSIRTSQNKERKDDYTVELQITDMDAKLSDSFDAAFDEAVKKEKG